MSFGPWPVLLRFTRVLVLPGLTRLAVIRMEPRRYRGRGSARATSRHRYRAVPLPATEVPNLSMSAPERRTLGSCSMDTRKFDGRRLGAYASTLSMRVRSGPRCASVISVITRYRIPLRPALGSPKDRRKNSICRANKAHLKHRAECQFFYKN